MHATSRSFTGSQPPGSPSRASPRWPPHPLAPPPQVLSPPVAAHDVRLAAAAVSPGGLVTSFLRNQLIYCSIICPFFRAGRGDGARCHPADTGHIRHGPAIRRPAQGDRRRRRVGDRSRGRRRHGCHRQRRHDCGTQGAERVRGRRGGRLLNIVPAAAGGLPAVVTAIDTARQDTFTALNRPVVANPTPTVVPHGVVQVGVVEAINVGAAVIFPALNDILLGGFQTVDAAAQTLARTGDPAMAVAASATTATGALTEAGSVVADSVVTAVSNIRREIDQSRPRAASPINKVQRSPRQQHRLAPG